MAEKRVKWSAETIELLRYLNDQGASVQEMAAAIGTTPSSIHVHASRHSIKLRSCHVKFGCTPDLLCALDAEAARFGVHRETLLRRLVTVILEDRMTEAVLDEDIVLDRPQPQDCFEFAGA